MREVRIRSHFLRRSVPIGLIALFVAASVVGQPVPSQTHSDDFVPWSFSGDRRATTSVRSGKHPILRGAINLYREHSDSRTTDRCIFHVSCSHFLEEAVAKHGIIPGVVRFIDRNMYRENLQAYGMYETRYRPDGRMKVDDGLYLE